jgi:hypothetical protein
MGKYDSSRTRVQPVFRQLLERDPTGESWLSDLLRSASLAGQLGDGVIRDPGVLINEGRTRFEYPAPPSDAFLRWLLLHPQWLRWPVKSMNEIEYGEDTQRRRERLLGKFGPGEQTAAQREALAELDKLGASGSARRWWAFEGFTKVDFCIQTDRLVVFVEGKRTEKLSASNDWFASRSQLVRNLEVIAEVAGARACGVILAVEHLLDDLEDDTLVDSTPHLTSEQRTAVRRRYLGQARWCDICDVCGLDFASLPTTVE